MKIVPKYVDVMGLKYEVKLMNKVSTDEAALAYHYAGKCLIEIASLCGQEKRCVSRIHETLLHELIHAVDHNTVNVNMEEDDVERLANGLYNLLSENNVFSYVDNKPPKTIKLCGNKYSVEFPYNDLMDERIYYVNYSSNIIGLRKNTSNMELARDYIRSALFDACCSIITKIFIINSLNNDNVHNTIIAGIFQVLWQNKLERLIRDGYEGILR